MSTRRLGAALAAAALVASIVAWVPVAGGVAGAQLPTNHRLILDGQTPFATPGGDFMLRLHVDRNGPPVATDIGVTIYKPVQTRSEFVQTEQDHITRAAITSTTSSLATLPTDTSGDVVVHVPLDLGTDDGVYPVRVDLRDRTGTALERFTTHLVYLGGAHTGPKLAVSLIMPVSAGISLPADGSRQIPGLDGLVSSIQALDADRSLPFTLVPSPETVAALGASNEDRAGKSLDALRRIAVDHAVLASPYVPISLPSLLAPGMGDEISDQLNRGAAVLSDALHVTPDTHTWVETEPLDPGSVDEMITRGADRVVASDAVLEPVPDLSLTLSRPFVLAGLEKDVPAVVGDPDLAGHFNSNANQVLEANHLIADLAVIWLDAPASARRAVVALPPTDWQANRPFLDTLVAGLTQNPTAEAVPLDTVFSSIAPAITSRGSALVRHPATVAAGGLGDVIPELRLARSRLTSLNSIVGTPTPATTLLEDRLLVSESSDLRGSKPRQAYIAAVETGIKDHLNAIQTPTGHSITLTARRGEIPVTFQNRTGSPVKVKVTVQSDKLEFPDGATTSLELTRRNTTERFSVVARTSGAFPLRITLESPDGNLLIGRGRLTVRSTAASAVGLAISIGAVLFLAIWWGRHIMRGRRAKRLVPA